jgi:integral membrane sensor domain MASE1
MQPGIIYASALGAVLATPMLRTLGFPWRIAFLIAVILAAIVGHPAADAYF